MASNNEITLKEVSAIVWGQRKLVMIVALGFSVLGIGTALLLPVKYKATAILAVSSGEDGKLGGKGAALLSQVGGLAGFAGISLGGAEKKAESIAVLESASLTQVFIQENNLLPILFEKKWNAKSKEWKDTDPKKIPTLWKGEKKFREDIRAVDEDSKTGLVTISVTWTDPQLAADWVNELVVRANNLLRERDIAESQRNIEYLNDQLTKSKVVELQKAIYSLLESEIKKVMIASGSAEYAFRVIDSARVPEEKISPKRAAICIAAGLMGIMMGITLALMRRLLGNEI